LPSLAPNTTAQPPPRTKKKPRQLALTGFLTLEARAGVEPTYTDLQSGA